MLRFLLVRTVVDLNSCPDGTPITTHHTIDAHVPELEAALSRGGSGAGCDFTRLVGAEVLPAKEEA